MGRDGCGGGSGTVLDGIGWYGSSGMSMESLGWMRRAWNWGGGPIVDVKYQRIVWRPRMGMESLIWFCFGV